MGVAVGEGEMDGWEVGLHSCWVFETVGERLEIRLMEDQYQRQDLRDSCMRNGEWFGFGSRYQTVQALFDVQVGGISGLGFRNLKPRKAGRRTNDVGG